MSAVIPVVVAIAGAASVRNSARRAERTAERRVGVERQRNILEYEESRRTDGRHLRRALSQLRAERAAAGFGGTRSAAALEAGLLREFADEDAHARESLGLRNERLGILPNRDGSAATLQALLRRVPSRT